MCDVSPFAAWQAAGSPPSASGAASGAARVVGFERSSSASLEARQTTCSAAERQGSLGGLNILFRSSQSRQLPSPPLGPRLSIQTTRSLRAATGGRPKRVTRIQEDAIAESVGGSTDDALLGTTASANRAPHITMSRACSGNIDMPSRLSKAYTAPECLPDSLVMAAITAGYASSHTRSPTAPAAAAPNDASPTRVTLTPRRSGSNDSSHCSTSNSNSHSTAHTACSGRPPMPVTPAFASARSGSGGQRHGSASSYRDLFDAQAETAMAQAQVNGLQEALRRKNEEVERLQQELMKVSLERDDLKKVAASPPAQLPAFASTTFASGGGLGHSGWGSGAPAAPTAMPAPPMGRLAIGRSKSVGPRKAAPGAGAGDSSAAAEEAGGPRLQLPQPAPMQQQRQLPQPAPMPQQRQLPQQAPMQQVPQPAPTQLPAQQAPVQLVRPQVPVQRPAIAVQPQPWQPQAQQYPEATVMPSTMVLAFACQAMAFSFD